MCIIVACFSGCGLLNFRWEMYIVSSCFRDEGSIDADKGKDGEGVDASGGEDQAAHDGQDGEDSEDLLRNQI